MENSKVSVIVPAYNAEKYIAKCIESVLAQTHHNIELIIVNDGSKDRTLSIIQKYKENHDCIIVIDKPNSGVSDTRNTGINASKGEYIVFLDSDDTLQNDYIERHVAALSPDVDLVISKLFNINKNEDYCTVDSYNNLYHNRTLPWGFPFCKLFKSEIIKRHSVSFNTKMRLCEDWMFVMDYIRYTNKIAIINYIGYQWNTDNGASLSRGCSFEYRIHAYDVALIHLEEMHSSRGIKDNDLYHSIRKNNMWLAVERLYESDNGREAAPYKERKALIADYYDCYGSSMERLILNIGVLPFIIDKKIKVKRLYSKIIHLLVKIKKNACKQE